jgi:hypothetical protein
MLHISEIQTREVDLKKNWEGKNINQKRKKDRQ